MPPVAYSGALQPKKKQELQDIALALRLSDQGTKDELQARIKKHLDANQDALEDDPKFAGLFGRRKRSVQPQPQPVPQALSGRFAPSTSDNVDKPKPARRSVAALDPIKEATPTKDLRDVSMFLKHPPVSPLESTPAQSSRQLDVITPSSLPPLPPSPAKSLIEALPKASEVKAVVELKQQQALQNGVELVVALRAFLSNSRNIWSLTSVFELLYIISVSVPWQSYQLSLGYQEKSISFLYPPASTFQSHAFWQVILQWAIPTLILPSFLGCMISFNPAYTPAPTTTTTTTSSLPSAGAIAPLDPLTASIVRLAAQTAYPYPALSAYVAVSGLDVLGPNWRLLSASVGLAFAFAEAIAGAPQFVAKHLESAQRRRLTFANNDDDDEREPTPTRRALTLHENHETSPEVD